MSDGKPADIVQPTYSEWEALLLRNLQVWQRFGDPLPGISRAAIREQILNAAQSFTSSLSTVAAERNISLPAPSMQFDEAAPLVMTGHQPLLYHSGLLFKEEMLNEFSRAQSALALSVAIDTDEVDSGRITWPAIEDGVLTVREDSLADRRDGMCCEQVLIQSDGILKICSSMMFDLARGGMSQFHQPVVSAMQLYAKLEGLPIQVAHSIVRRAMTGHSHLEVPLSKIAALPEVQKFFAVVVADARGFAARYNHALAEHRAEHKIKNVANPFPDMEVGPDEVELPLWRIVGSSRQALRIAHAAAVLPSAAPLVPRGSIVTLLLRAFCADLFIHGLGGAKYDQFVDRFAGHWLGIELPAFVVASRTRYLFPGKVRDIEADLQLQGRLKEMVSHPQNFVGKGLFSVLEERELVEGALERGRLLARLQQAQQGAERSAVAQQLNGLNHRLRDALQHTELYRRLHEAGCSEAVLRQWRYREFPFFLFSALSSAKH